MVTTREKLELQKRLRLKVMFEGQEKARRLKLAQEKEDDELAKVVSDMGDAENPEPNRLELEEGKVLYGDFSGDDLDDTFGIPDDKTKSIETMEAEQNVWEELFKLQSKYEFETSEELVDELMAQGPELLDRAYEYVDDERITKLAEDVMNFTGVSLGDEREPYDPYDDDRNLNESMRDLLDDDEEETPRLNTAPWKGEFDIDEPDCCGTNGYCNEPDCECDCHASNDELEEGIWPVGEQEPYYEPKCDCDKECEEANCLCDCHGQDSDKYRNDTEWGDELEEDSLRQKTWKRARDRKRED